ncbi:hypothetical protein F0562_024903 [Nyssa sinensis]|uniref:3'-5' exonuclease domain-containing protein n=1 Tax=Nyssa sinensis TaxID=561372 RepID=A0A5J5BE12_9ASTE|nr:hypothetical protein F0562_024903 [Nyssa sinensis]
MNVTFFNDQIHTVVTHNPFIVERWISDIENSHHRRLHRLIVGLDVEWRPNRIRNSIENPAATLQLCVGHRCLIFQLLHASHFPQLLKDFLGNPNYTFVGVKIDGDVKKLMKDHGLEVAKAVDLGSLAEENGRMELRYAGLKIFAREVLGKEVEKRTPVRWSEWDNVCLTPAQNY